MSQGDVLNIFSEAMVVALKLAAPLLTVSIVIGLVVSIFQAATQIQEQTLTFVPKILAVFLVMILMGSFMMNTLVGFTNRIFGYIANIVS